MVALTDMAWGHSPASVDEGEELELSPGPWTVAALEPRMKQALSQRSLGVGDVHTWETGLGSCSGWAALSQLSSHSVYGCPVHPRACVYETHIPTHYKRHH